jgi:osmoprotectant transport system permease protein
MGTHKDFIRFHLLTVFQGLFFLVWIFYYPEIEAEVLSPLFGRSKLISRTPLYLLGVQHIQIALFSTFFAWLTAMIMGITVRVSRSTSLKELAMSVSAIGETIPTAAIIALAVPVLGYGNGPCLLALYIYAILPIVRNVVVGLEATSQNVVEAGEGMGMTRWQLLWRVELPLARPIILAGIRTAAVINISAATIGATVGAGGFGVPIISGIRTYDPLMVIQGSVPVLLLAFFIDRLLTLPKTSHTFGGAHRV